MHAGPMRLRPILMTTLATLGGMLPIALGIEAGSQTQAPLGTVVIGGLDHLDAALAGRRADDLLAGRPPHRAALRAQAPDVPPPRAGHDGDGRAVVKPEAVPAQSARPLAIWRTEAAPRRVNQRGMRFDPRPLRPGAGVRRVRRRRRSPASALRSARGDARRHLLDRFPPSRHHGQPVLLQRGVTFTVYADARGTERILPFDLIPRIVPAERLGLHRQGHRAARARAQRVSGRRVRRGEGAARRHRAARAGVLVAALRARGDRRAAAARHVHPRLGDRPRARRARQLSGARGQRAHAVGHLVRAREPRRAQARVPAPVRRLRPAAGRRLPAPPARRAARVGAAASRRSRHRAHDARHLQQRVLRAHAARAPHGRGAGRRQRPVRARQHASTRRRRAGRSASTCSTAASTTTSSTRCTSAPTRAWACRACSTPTAPAT